MMRYVMVLGIILVTIFLYVSYYTTPMASVDNRYAAYVSQEQQPRVVPSIQGNGDQNFYSISAAVEGNSSGGGGGAISGTGVVEEVKQQQQQQEQTGLQLEENSGGPSEATKRISGDTGSSSSSSNSNSSNDGGASIKAEGGVDQVKANLTSGEIPQNDFLLFIFVTKELLFPLSDLEQRAKANTSIVIPKVETPPKQEVLAKRK